MAKRQRLPHRGWMYLHTGRLHVLVQKAHKKITSHQQVTVGRQLALIISQKCLCLSTRLSKILLVSFSLGPSRVGGRSGQHEGNGLHSNPGRCRRMGVAAREVERAQGQIHKPLIRRRPRPPLQTCGRNPGSDER